jgi:hypothetical protein
VMPPAGSLAMGARLHPSAASKRDHEVDLHMSGSNIGSGHVAYGFSTETSRLPPVTLLAPLQLLQSHRRGSITSPKLHATSNLPLLRSPGPISEDFHTGSLVPTSLHDLSERMATSAIAASSSSVATTKPRNRRVSKQVEDAGEHLGACGLLSRWEHKV